MKTKQAAKHTPGPWNVVYNDAYIITHPTGDRTYRYIATTDSQADCSIPIQLEDKQEDEANASLIAAAPDLLERLNTMALAFHENGRHGGQFSECDSAVCEDNRAAIQKAEGK